MYQINVGSCDKNKTFPRDTTCQSQEKTIPIVKQTGVICISKNRVGTVTIPNGVDSFWNKLESHISIYIDNNLFKFKND